MKKLNECTTTGNTTPGGYNKVVSTVIKRTIMPDSNINTKNDNTTNSSCPCKKLPGKVVCGICNPRGHR